MVNLIEFPANKVASDSLPEPGDAYEAYGLAHRSAPPMIAFVHADGAMTGFPYDALSFMHFRPLDSAGEEEGECVITLAFGSKLPDGGATVVITGRNLRDFFGYFALHQVRWLWSLPEDQAVAEDGSPLVRTMELKEIDRRKLDDLLFGDDTIREIDRD